MDDEGGVLAWDCMCKEAHVYSWRLRLTGFDVERNCERYARVFVEDEVGGLCVRDICLSITCVLVENQVGSVLRGL